MNNNKEELIKSFSQLTTSEKRKEFGKELSETAILIYKLLADITNNKNNIDINQFTNLFDGNITEDEYLTGLYEDFLNYKELLSIYLDKTIVEYYE